MSHRGYATDGIPGHEYLWGRGDVAVSASRERGFLVIAVCHGRMPMHAAPLRIAFRFGTTEAQAWDRLVADLEPPDRQALGSGG